MICYDPWTVAMFTADPKDIRDKVLKVNAQLNGKPLAFEEFLKVMRPERGHFKTNSRRLRALNSRH